MFGFLKKNKPPSFPDKIWKTQSIAWKQMTTEALQILHRHELPFVVFFFSDLREAYEQSLRSLNVPFVSVEEGHGFDYVQGTVYTVHVSLLSSAGFMDTLALQQSQTKLNFLFAGHYPLPATEIQVLEKLVAGLGAGFDLNFWMSLEDPIMKTFGGDRLGSLLEKMGFRDDECVEHAMVTKSILRAREKIEDHVKNERHTDSEQEWYALNVSKL